MNFFSQQLDQILMELETGNYETGLKALEELEVISDKEEEKLEIINVYLLLGFVDKVKELLNDLPADSHYPLEIARLRAQIEFKEGNFDAAQEIMHHVIENQPIEEDFVFLSQLYFDDGLPEVSLNYINKAIELDEKQPYYYYQKGVYAFELGFLEETIDSFSKAIELDSEESVYKLALGESLFHYGKFEDALEQYDHVLKLEPNQEQALFLKGMLLIQINQFEDGIIYLERVAALQPENLDLLISLAEVYERSQQYNKSLETLKKILTYDEFNLPALRRLGEIYLYQEEWEKAKEILDIALSIDPEDQSLKLMYAKILKAYGDVQEAIKQYEDIQQKSPFEGEICHNLGDLYLKNGEIEKAIHCYEEHLRVEPSFTVLNQLAACYAELKDYDRALEAINQSLSINPEQGSLVTIKEQLEGLLK